LAALPALAGLERLARFIGLTIMITAHWRVGLLLSVGTAIMWGFLPVSLSPLLGKMDIYTITFYRLIGGAALLYIWLIAKGHKFTTLKQPKSVLGLLSLAILGLAANYFFWLKGLGPTSPATAQVVIQLAPMLLLIGGVVIFKEAFSKIQAFGVVIFTLGLGLFFNNRIDELINEFSDYALGISFIVLAAVTWAVYALAQKQLLKHFNALELIFYICIISSLIFLPFSQFDSVSKLNGFEWSMLLFAVSNTAIAYGFFTSAMHYWPATRVSAVIATVPVFTLIISELQQNYMPEIIPPEMINELSIVGALLVVFGSAVTALAKSRSA
jgi:drug/metabolite transporter (DMT)-like permease